MLMTNLSWIGTLSLNTSFVIYMILYVPQIIHNQKLKNISQLSLWLQCILFLSYAFDLLYGYSSHMPWQYKTVSIVGLLLLTVQHLQLLKLFIQQRNIFLIQVNLAFLVLTGMMMYYFLIIAFIFLDSQNILLFGAIARVCGLIYCIPQIIKNQRAKYANALSPYFIYLNLLLAILDSISSWCLDWGWPNKLAAPITLCMMLYMLFQNKKYSNNSFSNSARAPMALT